MPNIIITGYNIDKLSREIESLKKGEGITFLMKGTTLTFDQACKVLYKGYSIKGRNNIRLVTPKKRNRVIG